MKSQGPSTVWHYSTAIGFLSLLKSGKVDVSTKDLGPGERPVAWFSSNPIMEFTIREMAIERGDGTFLRSKTPADYRIMGMGLYRVAAHADAMLRWVDLVKAAKIGMTRRRKLETTARKVCANPFEWFGRFEPLVLDDAIGLEVFDGAVWRPLAKDGAAARVLEEQRATGEALKHLIASKRSDRAPSQSERLL